VDALNSFYSSVDGVLFNKSQTTLIVYPRGKGGAYTIPNSVTSLGGSAFSGCKNLTSVTIGNSVSSIGSSAFSGCKNLTSVTIPNSVTSLGGGAFSGCTSLTSITIPNGVTSIGYYTFQNCTRLTSVTIGSSVTNIGNWAFYLCTNLTSITMPSRVTSIGNEAFYYCTSLTNVTIGNSVTSIEGSAFQGCSSLTSVTIPNSVTSIGNGAFDNCTRLTNVTIGNSVTSIADSAFYNCTRLTGVYFQGNAPSLGGASVFASDNNTTVYYLPGTTGWYATFGGRPTALWIQVPTIQTSPQTQTAEAGSAVGLWVDASSPLPLFYLWRLNDTNLTSWSTNGDLELTNVQFAQSGAYTVVVSNVLGAATSGPAMLNVIAAVERRLVPGVKVTGQPGSLLNVDYADSLNPAPIWTTLGSVSLTSTSQYYFDLAVPLPPQRFYRAWQAGTPVVMPSLDLHLVPAITMAGNIGGSVRLDYINQFGPTDAWVTLDTVTLTNTSQLYFDTSAWGQPQRLYRLVPLP
jgi:hypothetical protein